MLRRSRIVVALVAAVAGFGSTAHAFEIPAAPLGRLSDFAGALDGAARQRIEAQLAAYAEGSPIPYAVALFKSLDGESDEDLSIRIAKAWKIGDKKTGGVLITVYLAEHKMRIEVGYGLEEKLTDVFCARVEREILAPAFRAGDLAGGLERALATIDQQATGRSHGAPLAPRPQPRSRDQGRIPGLVLFVIVIALLLLTRRGGGGGGGFGSFAGGLLTGMTLGGRGGGGWSGGGGGGGFGGFGGDGGGFGGGGSSGDW